MVRSKAAFVHERTSARFLGQPCESQLTPEGIRLDAPGLALLEELLRLVGKAEPLAPPAGPPGPGSAAIDS